MFESPSLISMCALDAFSLFYITHLIRASSRYADKHAVSFQNVQRNASTRGECVTGERVQFGAGWPLLLRRRHCYKQPRRGGGRRGRRHARSAEEHITYVLVKLTRIPVTTGLFIVPYLIL